MQVNNEFTKLIASNLNFFYGSKQVLKNISLSFNKKEITAINRTLRLWEKYFSENIESYERFN